MCPNCIETKDKHKVYTMGSFYFKGLMYNTDDGSLITELNSVDVEMMRIGDKLEKEWTNEKT
jgi:hypothetical protein